MPIAVEHAPQREGAPMEKRPWSADSPPSLPSSIQP
jgi:hypothetical protein